MSIPPHRANMSFGMSSIDPRDAPALSLLGHDLRAALSEVIGGLRLIDPDRLPYTVQAQILRTRAAGEALALLLEQALSVLTNELDTPDHPAPVLQTDRVIEALCLRWTERMSARGLQFAINGSADLPKHIGIEPALLERVLSNLLGNALKYAGTGKVCCNISAPTGTLLQITVTDQGPGFSAALQKSLFTSFGRPRAVAIPGTGLGLMIVHEMVVQAGGTIVARNRPEGGAEIIVRLPLPKIDVAMIENLPDLINHDLSALRVLVADDNATSRLLNSRLLINMGAEVVTACDGVEAIGRIERESFDLAMIDIEMPQMNGLDVIRHVRAMDGPIANLPILAVTAYRLRANKTAIDAAGADGIVSKPVPSAAALHATVVAAISRRLELSNFGQLAGPEQAVPLQLAKLLKMAGPENALEILFGIQSDLGKIERGLLAAAHGPDWQKVSRHTHNLIAIAGTAGDEHLQELATQMNDLANSPAPDLGTFLTLLPQTLESIDAMIQFVGDYATNFGKLA